MTEKPHERLDRLMNLRRLELPRIGGKSVKWFQIAERAGITVTTLSDVRKGKTNPSEDTRRGIEDALQWQHGSMNAILAGGEPVAVEGIGERGAESPFDEEMRLIREIRERVEALQALRETRGTSNHDEEAS